MKRRRQVRWIAAAVSAVAFSAGPAQAQPGYEAELSVIGDFVLGDWYEVGRSASRWPYHIRLQPNGVFLSGRSDVFGRFPSRWRAERTTLVNQETLTVRWPEQGECVYYVGFGVEDGVEIMTWRPYKDYRDFGAFDGIITRALMPWGPCGPRTWTR